MTENWTLDRRVPVALIVVLAIQTTAIIWWAASLSVRVNTLETQAVTMNAAFAPHAERIVRVETKVDMLSATLTEIKDILRGPRQDR